MTVLAQKIAFNLDGVHVLNSGETIAASGDAQCKAFAAITAVGGDVLIASLTDADLTGDGTNITLGAGQQLIVRCTAVTLGASTGKAVLTKIK